MRVESLCIVPMIAIGNALLPHTAQNIGAGKPERVVQGYRVSNLMVVFCAAVLCVALELFNGPIVAFSLETAARLLRRRRDGAIYRSWAGSSV